MTRGFHSNGARVSLRIDEDVSSASHAKSDETVDAFPDRPIRKNKIDVIVSKYKLRQGLMRQ